MSSVAAGTWLRPLRKFAKTPKGYALAGLILLTLVAGLSPQGHIGVIHAGLAVATAIVLDTVIARLLGRKLVVPAGGMITGLIVADVLSDLTSGLMVMLTVAIALASKHLLKRGRKPIFNPAALGLAISLASMSTAQSWWAAMPLLSWWHVALLLIVGVVVAVRTKKAWQVLAFLGTYFVEIWLLAIVPGITVATSTAGDALRTPFVNATLFLGFFMLTDPPTTPSRVREQIGFAVLVATVSVVIFWQIGGLAYLLVGLLVGNLWTAWQARRRKSHTGMKFSSETEVVAGSP
ncbi:MAG: hypothetical protein C7B45_05525 [Sulfobacillus acidophilus]|uniref:Uncharacterized protein n=1 Tax=Sulfobacillus acidophilus TaxID=53633 RepID=A0A2T2WKM2_9FIRM|nr:MAG: hypothetical protein C7B45_05525 [Sulfobacillus acidophilus]